MNQTHDKHPVHPEAGVREAGLDELVKDASRLGPAPTRSREGLAGLVNLAVLGAGIALVRPEPIVSAILVAAVLGYLGVRWVVGTRKWGHR